MMLDQCKAKLALVFESITSLVTLKCTVSNLNSVLHIARHSKTLLLFFPFFFKWSPNNNNSSHHKQCMQVQKHEYAKRKTQKTVSHFWFRLVMLVAPLLLEKGKEWIVATNSNNNHNNVGDLCDTVICFFVFKKKHLLLLLWNRFVWLSCFGSGTYDAMSTCALVWTAISFVAFFSLSFFCWFDLWKILLGKA